jgi:hypothetical protein
MLRAFYLSIAAAVIDLIVFAYFLFNKAPGDWFPDLNKIAITWGILLVICIYWIIYFILTKKFWFILIPLAFISSMVAIVIWLRNS